jgi:hypothetical protein
MSGLDDFWKSLRQLADAYAAEGLNREERIENILAKFSQMSPLVRRQVLNSFRQLANDFPDLFALSVAADRLAEKESKSRSNKDIA